MQPPQVITPSAGGPAERAGVAPRDVLLAIGSRPTADLSLYEAGDLLQGPPGSQVWGGENAACFGIRKREVSHAGATSACTLLHRCCAMLTRILPLPQQQVGLTLWVSIEWQ